MTKSTTYFSNGVKHDTYKFIIPYLHDQVVKILVKKDGIPFQVVSFTKISGRMIKPKESYQNIIELQK